MIRQHDERIPVLPRDQDPDSGVMNAKLLRKGDVEATIR